MTAINQVSTSSLAKKVNLPSKELFELLQQCNFIRREDENWLLTDKGLENGGQYNQSKRFGKYITWPDNLCLETLKPAKNDDKKPNLTARKIAEQYGTSANKINQIFSELGWLKKHLKGWKATGQGLKVGAQQSEDYRSGIPYVVWPESILENKPLNETVNQFLGNEKEPDSLEETKKEFRDKFKATHRTTDGHMVRSKAEVLIDNWLYMAEIVHAYERKLPIEEDVYCDFYIPSGKVYIEYWGLEENPKYQDRKTKKIEIYKKYGFNLIELTEKEVLNLDDYLPKLLLKYDIQAY